VIYEEDIARQKLHLAYSAPDRRRPIERNRFVEGMGVLFGLIAAVALVLVVWPIVCMIFSLE
jgi:hypothetical protein